MKNVKYVGLFSYTAGNCDDKKLRTQKSMLSFPESRRQSIMIDGRLEFTAHKI